MALPDVLTFSHHALAGHGYRVLTARHGDEALRQATGFKDEIDLLITDVVMPDLSGRDVAERLRAVRRACGCYTSAVTPTTKSCNTACSWGPMPSSQSRFRRPI
jgi:CheY-like chemotaxis protein